jgi:hypothetical protein
VVQLENASALASIEIFVISEPAYQPAPLMVRWRNASALASFTDIFVFRASVLASSNTVEKHQHISQLH